MKPEPDAIRQCLRAFADAQTTQFHPLWTRLARKAGRAIPPPQFRIHRSDSGPDAASVVLAVEVFRNDGLQITWCVRLNAAPEHLEVSGGVEVHTDEDGSREVFTCKESAADSRQAAELIARLSAEVCAQDSFMERPIATRK